MDKKNKIKILMVGAGIIIIFLLLLNSNFLKGFEKRPNKNLNENLASVQPKKYPIGNSNLNLPNLNINTPNEYLLLYMLQEPEYSNSGRNICPVTKFSTDYNEMINKMRV